MGYELSEYTGLDISVTMTDDIHRLLESHFDMGPHQEDLTFAYWRPSVGRARFTGVLGELALPGPGERILQGNVAFESQYLLRVLRERPAGCGIALLHSHLGPGWQGMSEDDVVAERDRMGGAVAAGSGLPVLGLTYGTDGSWSARIWCRKGPSEYVRIWANSVRVVGRRLAVTWSPFVGDAPVSASAQAATLSVWGDAVQGDLARVHIGVVGLGSVGSIVCEALARIGVSRVTFIDHDVIEVRNLDRTMGATQEDAKESRWKVEVAERSFKAAATATSHSVCAVSNSLLTEEGLEAALACDVLFSCVDRPLPRHVLNVLSYGHLIPVVDGGILAKVDEDGHLLHVDWRIHSIGPGRRCLVCSGALLRSDVALDRDGRLDDPDYVANLSETDRERYSRRNVFPFSLSVAAHETLHLVALLGGGQRVGGIGPQMYHAYPGRMDVVEDGACESDCEYSALLATAPSADQVGVLRSHALADGYGGPTAPLR